MSKEHGVRPTWLVGGVYFEWVDVPLLKVFLPQAVHHFYSVRSGDAEAEADTLVMYVGTRGDHMTLYHVCRDVRVLELRDCQLADESKQQTTMSPTAMKTSEIHKEDDWYCRARFDSNGPTVATTVTN